MNTDISPINGRTRMSWLSRALTGATSGPPIPVYDSPTTAVLAIDLQRDFLADDARMPIALSQVDPLLGASNTVLGAARLRGWRVVTIGNEFPPDNWLGNLVQRGAAIRGSRGAEIDPRVIRVTDAYFAKERRDAFSNSALDAWLRAAQVNHLVVIGIMANACVRATVLGARNRGYRVTVVRDAVGASSDGARASALASLARVGVKVVSAAEIVRESAPP